jgi:hypothetical protein
MEEISLEIITRDGNCQIIPWKFQWVVYSIFHIKHKFS